MNLREALTHNVRSLIADWSQENWSDARLIESMLYAVREARHRLHSVNREWFADLIVLTADDLVEVEGMHVWELPTRIERVTGVFTDDDLQCKIPYRQAKNKTYSGTTWMILPSYKRRLAFTGTLSSMYVRYLPRVPALHYGVISAVGADNLTLQPTAGRQSMWDDAYRSWPLEITDEDAPAAGTVYQPESSVYNPAAAPTTTVTMDAALAAPLPQENNEYSLMLPWDGRMDEALCALCAYRVAVTEGHRRQAQELQGMITVAMEDFYRAAVFEGDDTGGVVEDVNG